MLVSANHAARFIAGIVRIITAALVRNAKEICCTIADYLRKKQCFT